MKVESIIFGFIGLLMLVSAVVYGIFSQPTEVIGTTALVLSAGLCWLIGGFFWFVARRIEPRPEDRKDATIEEGAGELGFFPPHSYWPFGVALCAAILAVGLAFWYAWLIIMGIVFLLITIGGLVFEYYVGQNASQT